MLKRLQIIGGAVAMAALITTVPVAEAAHWGYDSGNFSGQRGVAMKFGQMEDYGWYGHFNGDPDGPLVTSVDQLELHDPLQGQAICTMTQQADATLTGPTLQVWNHGRVEAEAGSAGALRNDWTVSGPYRDPHGYVGVAHSDSGTWNVKWQLLPDDGTDEAFGDPVWLTFRGELSVSHHINDRGFGQSTERWGYRVTGELGGAYPAPYTVYLQGPDNVRRRPALRADGDYDYSTRFFDGQRIPARIGDTINLVGGALSWLSVTDVEVSVSERASSEMQTNVRVTASEADEFAFVGPLEFGPGADQRGVLIDVDRYTPDAPMAPWSFGAPSAMQDSEVTSYWLSSDGRCDSGAESLYDVSFTLEEATDYQLHMILDTRGDGFAEFDLAGPTPIQYDRTGDGWTPRWLTGNLAPGDYHLTAKALGGTGPDDWSNVKFDMTFGEPEIIPPDDPPGMVLRTGFPLGGDLGAIGLDVGHGSGGTVEITPNPLDPGDDGALLMLDPGDEPLTLGLPLLAEDLVTVEFEYHFVLPGKIGIFLNGELVDEVYSEGTSAFVLYQETFALLDFGLIPGPGYLELKLTNPDAIDPEAYIDDLVISTVIPEPSSMSLLCLGIFGLLSFARRRQ